MSNPDRPAYDAHLRTPPVIVTQTPATRVWDAVPPRVRVNVKRLATGQWQPDITVESFDADPLTNDGRRLILGRLQHAKAEVDTAITSWGADAGPGEERDQRRD